MSEIKSPFLNNENNSNNNGFERNQDSDPLGRSVINADTVEPVKNAVQREAAFAKSSSGFGSENEGDTSLEIQEEGKTLRRVIVIMIILLVIALMGLFAYNALNKKEELPKNDIKQGNSLEITDFDMKGGEFQAKSIIIEE